MTIRTVLKTIICLWMFANFCGCSDGREELPEGTESYLQAQDALAAGDTDTALQHLNRSIELEPDVWAYYARAKIYAERDDAAAIADCEAGLAIDPEHEELKWLRKELKKPQSSRFQGRRAEPPATAK